MKFELSEKEIETLDEWKAAIKIVYGEVGELEYRFRPSGIGNTVIVYSSIANTTKNITDIDAW